MTAALRVGAYLLLAICGWMGADGLRRAGAGGPLARVYFPLDADRLPESASEARILGLKPVSPFARFRDALGRSEDADGEAFRLAARGVLRWGRNQPGVLVDLGTMALVRWRARGEAPDREIGEALLVEYTRRTTHADGEGLRVWVQHVGVDGDPFSSFSQVRRELWPEFGAGIQGTHPTAAWQFLLPALRDGSLDSRYALTVAGLARSREERAVLPALRALAGRRDLTPTAAEALEATIATLSSRR